MLQVVGLFRRRLLSSAITQALGPATRPPSSQRVCPATGEQRELAFQGFEADRNALKHRCPAAAYELECQGQAQYHQAGGVTPGDYGRVVLIKLDE